MAGLWGGPAEGRRQNFAAVSSLRAVRMASASSGCRRLPLCTRAALSAAFCGITASLLYLGIWSSWSSPVSSMFLGLTSAVAPSTLLGRPAKGESEDELAAMAKVAIAGSAAIKEESMAKPGVYIARTQVPLRSEPDIASAPNGLQVKEGEVFEVTEVVHPLEPDGLTYLRVADLNGDRGWVHDKGLDGSWEDEPVVEAAGVFSEFYLGELRDPVKYAEYRADVDSPDYVSRIGSWEEMKQMAAKIPQGGGEADLMQALLENPEAAQRLDERVAEFGEDYTPSTDELWGLFEECLAEVSFMTPEQSVNMQAGFDSEDGQDEEEELEKEPTSIWDMEKPKTVVAPKWMKLEGREMRSEVDEDGNR
eukprot:CAMPEP_0115704716 /NCGR_PEP_ID=MMETSP0272-20121206/69828_1 /TAXON_ID=71861 /ORGANISM="Scrippsiella trochoidea, Strain CCMP3099" /LENGTH=363 /DNA_ID=CAMNT_0003145761 /DNA_START=24 /DNA_END=1112 /DNA_ORIENTATION=+